MQEHAELSPTEQENQKRLLTPELETYLDSPGHKTVIIKVKEDTADEHFRTFLKSLYSEQGIDNSIHINPLNVFHMVIVSADTKFIKSIATMDQIDSIVPNLTVTLPPVFEG